MVQPPVYFFRLHEFEKNPSATPIDVLHEVPEPVRVRGHFWLVSDHAQQSPRKSGDPACTCPFHDVASDVRILKQRLEAFVMA